ncbi:caspase family protein [Ferrimonas pelagia]|uniref:Peptidase C14 caspase domain-containing protein n=1 Tax=Ferrimonas pelagia TaxID=1177826 RepID=A0ABP9EBL1_9GAMM
MKLGYTALALMLLPFTVNAYKTNIAAHELYLEAKRALERGELIRAEDKAKQAQALNDQDGSILLKRESVHQRVGSGRFVRRDVEFIDTRKEYQPGWVLGQARLEEARAEKRQNPPQLKLRSSVTALDRNIGWQAGHPAQMRLELSNLGRSAAESVVVSVSAKQQGVILSQAQWRPGDLASGEDQIFTLDLDLPRDFAHGQVDFVVTAEEKDSIGEDRITSAAQVAAYVPPEIEASLMIQEGVAISAGVPVQVEIALVNRGGAARELSGRLQVESRKLMTFTEGIEFSRNLPLLPQQEVRMYATLQPGMRVKEGESLNFFLQLEDHNEFVDKLPLSVRVTGDQVVRSHRDYNFAKAAQTNPNAYALVIGNLEYQNNHTVYHANRDVEVMQKVFERSLGVPTSQILTAEDVTLAQLQRLMADRSTPGSFAALVGDNAEAEVYVFYAGHGSTAENIGWEHYLMATDSDWQDLPRTALKLSEMMTVIQSLPGSRPSIFLDTCFSGVSSTEEDSNRSSVRFESAFESTGNGYDLYQASQHCESHRHSHHGAQQGLFTYVLAHGLSNDAAEGKSLTNEQLGQYLRTHIPGIANQLGAMAPEPVIEFGTAKRFLAEYQ